MQTEELKTGANQLATPITDSRGDLVKLYKIESQIDLKKYDFNIFKQAY
jgi:hypothetical protein